MTGTVQVWPLGRVDYDDGLRMQEALVALRREGRVSDTLLLLEHPPVITLGRGADQNNIIASKRMLSARGIEVFETGRGGDVTYHGSGQLVGYPIIDLNPDRRDIRKYMRDLEEVLILTLQDYGITAGRIDGLTGVWVGNRKIAALGVRVSRWLTSHGFALNVSTRLDDFNLIVPCGITDKAVTSIEREIGEAVSLDDIGRKVADQFAEVFGRELKMEHVQHHSVQVVIYRERNGVREYLMLHRLPERGDFWQPVTGSIKRKREETPIEAARRELFEETGYEAAVSDLDYVHTFIVEKKWSKKGMEAHQPIFNREHSFCVRVSGDYVAISPKEHDGYEWLPYDEAFGRLIWPGNRKAFQKVARIPIGA